MASSVWLPAVKVDSCNNLLSFVHTDCIILLLCQVWLLNGKYYYYYVNIWCINVFNAHQAVHAWLIRYMSDLHVHVRSLLMFWCTIIYRTTCMQLHVHIRVWSLSSILTIRKIYKVLNSSSSLFFVSEYSRSALIELQCNCFETW